jgi:hypothetical protein
MEKPPFWSSLPGILTGVAAVITAATGLYLASRDAPSKPDAAAVGGTLATPATKPIASQSATTEWEAMAKERFADNAANWMLGSFADEYFRDRTLAITGGKYRWTLDFARDWSGWVPAPFGPQMSFQVAVDAVVLEASVPGTSLGLVFGHAGENHYEFRIRDGYFGISRLSGTGHDWIIRETPIRIVVTSANRLAVQVEDGLMTFTINGHQVGQYRDPAFSGGTIGMFAASASGTRATVEFDNFELHRKLAR